MENKIEMQENLFSEEFINFIKNEDKRTVMREANQLFATMVSDESGYNGRNLYFNEIVDIVDHVCDYFECGGLLDKQEWYMTQKVKVTCPKHGEVHVTPFDYFNGVVCPICGDNENEDFEKKFKDLVDLLYPC